MCLNPLLVVSLTIQLHLELFHPLSVLLYHFYRSLSFFWRPLLSIAIPTFLTKLSQSFNLLHNIDSSGSLLYYSYVYVAFYYCNTCLPVTYPHLILWTGRILPFNMTVVAFLCRILSLAVSGLVQIAYLSAVNGWTNQISDASISF